MLTGRMIYDRFPEDWMVQIAFIPDTVIFIFGPLTYLFVSRLLSINSNKYTFLHFFPALIYALLIIYFFTLGSTYFDHLITTPEVWDLILKIETFGLISNISYLVVCFALLNRYKSKSKDAIAFQQPTIIFIKNYLIIVTLCLSLWVFSYVSGYFIGYFSAIVNYSTVWFSMPFASYLVGYYLITKPPLFSWNFSVNKRDVGRLHPELVNQLKEKLDNLICNERVYMREDLTLKELSDLIDTSVHNLSWLLNDVYEQCFYDFINTLRIKAFAAKIEDGEHIKKTILALALEVGFKSKSTFNKSFKSVYQTTPSNYIKEVESTPQVKLRYSA